MTAHFQDCWLLEFLSLSDWERGFIQSVKRQKKLSEKQQFWFEKIKSRFPRGAKREPQAVADHILLEIF